MKKNHIGNFLKDGNTNAALGDLLTFYYYCYVEKNYKRSAYKIGVHTGDSINKAFCTLVFFFFFLDCFFGLTN